MKNDFCCEGLQAIIESPKCPLRYRSYTRDFVLTVPEYLRKKSKKYDIIYPNFKISNCPRCGKQLPESLADAWYDIMEKEFGLSGLIGPEEAHLIPEEYKTDEWWRKRGL